MICLKSIKTYGPRYQAFCTLLFISVLWTFLPATLHAEKTCILETGLIDDDYYETSPDSFSITVESLGGKGDTIKDIGIFRINRDISG